MMGSDGKGGGLCEGLHCANLPRARWRNIAAPVCTPVLPFVQVAEVRGRPDVVLLTLTQANRNDMAADAFGRVMAALEHAGCRAS